MWAAHNFLENFWGSSAVFWSLWALVSIHTCVYEHTYSTNTHTHHTNTHKTSHVHTTHLTYTQIHTQTHTCYTHTKSLKSQQKRQHVRYTSGLGFNSHWLRLLWVIGRRRESGGGVWLTKGQGWVKVGQELRVGYEVLVEKNLAQCQVLRWKEKVDRVERSAHVHEDLHLPISPKAQWRCFSSSSMSGFLPSFSICTLSPVQ